MSAAPSDTPSAAAPAKDAQNGCLPRGFRLREFVIERVLGDGGFGVVYSALDLRLERRVAIKEYMPSSLARRDTDYSVQMLTSKRHRDAFEVGLRSFINEARLLARFEHPALIKVHQFWQEKGTAYMVMPYYAAPTLRNWVRSQQQPVGEAWLRAFLLSAMEAVEVMHGESCLHRDIAPDNILVLKDANPLLLDFGAARRVIGDLRKALTVIVKPGFAPLEQYADTVKMKQGPWTDVYALAAVGHFVITGHPPAPAVSRVLADEVVPLRVRAKGRYSDALLGALDTALAVKPERRPQTIAAFRDLLLSTQPGEWEPTRLVRRAPEGSVTHKAIVAATRPATINPPQESTPARERAEQAAPRSVQKAAAPVGASPRTVPSALRATATTMQRSAARLADVTTLTHAVRESMSPSKQHSRWVGIAGYAAALLAFGGALALTSYLVEGYVESNARGEAMASIVRKMEAPVRVETPVAETAPARLSGSTAMVEAKPTEVTLAPSRLDPPSEVTVAPAPAPVSAHVHVSAPAPRPVSAPVSAPVKAPVSAQVAAPARAAKPKPAAHAKVATIERTPSDAGKAALLLTAAAPATSSAPAPAASHGKTRGLDELVVPLERAADIAQVASVELVVAAPPQPAPLRAIARPQPQFPASAVKEGVRDGRVLAQMTVNGDGSIGRVDIVEAQPRNVFDKEVRRALSGWRYEAPGQPRHTTVEFVFKLDE